MLSDEIRATPRPKPPAKVRARKSSQASTKGSRGKASSGSPPPPYYSASDSMLGSPLPVTAQLLEASGGGNSGEGPGPESWLLEKSREELSGLLNKAEGIIKSREERTSFPPPLYPLVLFLSLPPKLVTLSSLDHHRNDRRFTDVWCIYSGFGFTSHLVQTLHEDNRALKSKYDSLIQRIPGASPLASPLGSPRSSIALSRPSSDGNTDMTFLRPQSPIVSSSMLTMRSTSSVRRKGSKRISITPAELAQLTDQNTQLSSQLEDLERDATKADEIAKRKLGKLEREIDRLKGDLDKALEQLQHKEREIERSSEAKKQRLERDERLLALRERQQQQHPQQEVVDFSPPPIPIKRFSRIPADDSEEQVSFPTGSYNAEVDLISRLMDKIRELEEANVEISNQQHESHRKLKKAMIGAEGMRKVYDCLSDDEDVEVEIVDDDEFVDATEHMPRSPLDSVPEEAPPIRFSSLRRTINEDIHKRLATEVSDDEERDHAYDDVGHAHARSRGTLAGLFDSPERRGRTVSLMNLEDEDSDDVDDSKIFSRGVSPIGSPLLMPQDPPNHIRSLGSELGGEYGENLDGTSSDHHHARTSSVFSLSALITDNSPLSRSRATSLIENSPTPAPKRPTSSHQRGGSVRDKERSVDTGTLDRSKSQLRSRLLNQTISARSTRWSDGRMDDMAISASKAPKVSSPSITEMFQTAVQQVTGSSSGIVADTPDTSQVVEINLDESRGNSPVPPAEETAEDGSVESKKPRAGFVGFVLEIWLWLQFVLIILFFISAMARRGPRNVLKEADRKKT